MSPPERDFDLLKFTDYHLSRVHVNLLQPSCLPACSLILSAIAVLVLILACFNCVNHPPGEVVIRFREMATRKVLGALQGRIARQFFLESLISSLAAFLTGLLLSKEFLLLIGLANLIAWPVAFYAGRIWLRSFAYRASLTFWIFALSALLGALFAIIPVAYHAVRTSLANPSDVLRYE